MAYQKLLPSIVVTALLLSACTSASAVRPIPPRPGGDQQEPAPVPPVPTPAPSPSPEPLPEPEPTPAPEPAPPAVTWLPRGIGMPLVPSDPAAVTKKVVMLTFDDGPSAHTGAILDTLAQENVHAVFFITGYGARQHPELVKRIHDEGHQLGIHTMTHPNMTKLAAAEQRKEIEPLIEQIETVSGKRPLYFRPPFGAYNQELLQTLKELDLAAINWTVGSLDWDGLVNGRKEPQRIVDDVMAQMHKGAVILFHDTMQHSADALPTIIERLRTDGYEFVTLP